MIAVIKVIAETIIINVPNFPTFPSESRAIYPVINPIRAKINSKTAITFEPDIRLSTRTPGKPTSATNPSVIQPLASMKSKRTEKNLTRK